MNTTVSEKFELSAAIIGVFFVLLNEQSVRFVEFLFFKKGWICSAEGAIQPAGLIVLGILLFFSIFGILNIM
jgi:hypothetical protein